MAPLSLAALKARKPPPTIVTTRITVPATKQSIPTSASKSSRVTNTAKATLKSTIRKSSTPRQSSVSTGSRPTSREPVERVKSTQPKQIKRSSPAVSTPRLTSSDEESAGEDEQPKKRPRLDRSLSTDTKRCIRDLKSFSEEDGGHFEMIHSEEIANSDIVEHSRLKYEAFFTVLNGDEDECPNIELEYPSASQREKYQIVKPTDSSDFKPIDEIMSNMKVVAEHYLDEQSASKVTNEEDGSGFVQMLQRFARDGLKHRIGAQSKFISIIEEYNELVSEKRKDGTIARKMDDMTRVDVKLVEHIVKNQVYARTVSPQVHLVRQYEGFSDNVYGELLPKFLSRIFKETHLKSNEVFVDLGSGVGNCVLQAALEVGCESWGCEMMDNPNKLAQDQAKEFPARCRLWGIKPGDVHLIHGDFITNTEIRDVLRRADVILINNQAFNPPLNDSLKYHFLDLKEGCQIVSLKYFRDPKHEIKKTKINDPVNVITVEEKDRFSGMVSWSDDPGKWYLHRKDSTELKAFEKKMGLQS